MTTNPTTFPLQPAPSKYSISHAQATKCFNTMCGGALFLGFRTVATVVGVGSGSLELERVRVVAVNSHSSPSVLLPRGYLCSSGLLPGFRQGHHHALSPSEL